jgi:hypothetical protein
MSERIVVQAQIRGKMVEAMGYDRPLTVAEMAELRGYVDERWMGEAETVVLTGEAAAAAHRSMESLIALANYAAEHPEPGDEQG